MMEIAKHFLALILLITFLAPTKGAVHIIDPNGEISPPCDTILLVSGHTVLGVIEAEAGHEMRVANCEEEGYTLVRKSSIDEIRYANGERRNFPPVIYDERPTREERVDAERRAYKRMIGLGLGLLAAAFILAIPLFYLAIGIAFGGAEGLALFILFIPVILFMLGLIKLIQGLIRRKRYKDRRRFT